MPSHLSPQDDNTKLTAAQERRVRDWLESHFVELDQLYNKRCAASLLKTAGV